MYYTFCCPPYISQETSSDAQCICTSNRMVSSATNNKFDEW